MKSFFDLPIYRAEHHWNDNVRASLSAFLLICEMLVNSLWYGASYLWSQGIGRQWFSSEILEYHTVNYGVLIPMGWATLFLLVFAIIMNRVFLCVTSKTPFWYICQSVYISVYMLYCTLFTQFFGENTIVVGLNLSGGVILGLLLLDRTLMLVAFSLSIGSFLLIGINRQMQWLPFETVYAKNGSPDYWFWIFSHMYFAVTKVIITILAVDWILKILRNQQKKIYDLSQRDTLTGINNRRTIYCYLSYLWQEQSTMDKVSVIYFDLDKFKHINDDYGHATGDKTLIEICQVVKLHLATYCRSSVKLGRIGGEEFVLILPNLSTEQALQIAEQLRQAIKQHTIISKPMNKRFAVTASFGVASLFYSESSQFISPILKSNYANFDDYLKEWLQVSPELPETMQDLINIASNGMRTAKRQGRDKVVDGGFTIAR